MKRVMVIRHVPHEALGNLETVLGAGALNLHVVDCFAPSWPAVEQSGFHPRQLAGLVVMGGPMNADETDRYPFLATEVAWLRQAVAAELPTLGICLGAQLLAKALGARVYPNRVKEIGWYDLEILPAAFRDPLLMGSREVETVFQWHGDTFDLPPGAIHLARSVACEHQAFRMGANTYGLQFHLEVTAEMVMDWLDEPQLCAQIASRDGIDSAEIRRRTPEAIGSMEELVRRVFSRFGRMCQASSGEC